MQTREIPRDEWVAFFDSFSRQHEGWLVRLEVFGSDIGAQVEAEEMPLQGIAADLKDGEETISIIIGEAPEQHVAHSIAAPTHVRLEETEQGAQEVLQIESADGSTTLLRFRSAVLPEMVDGVVT